MATTDEKVLNGAGLKKLWSIIKAKDTALANADANIIATHAKKQHTHPLTDLEQGWVLGCTVSGTLTAASAKASVSETKAITIPFIDGRPPDEIKIVVDCTLRGTFAGYSSTRSLSFRVGSLDAPWIACGFSIPSSSATSSDTFNETFTRTFNKDNVLAVSVVSESMNTSRVWSSKYTYYSGVKHAVSGSGAIPISISHDHSSSATSHSQNVSVYAIRSSDGGLASYSATYTLSIYGRNLP